MFSSSEIKKKEKKAFNTFELSVQCSVRTRIHIELRGVYNSFHVFVSRLYSFLKFEQQGPLYIQNIYMAEEGTSKKLHGKLNNPTYIRWRKKTFDSPT